MNGDLRMSIVDRFKKIPYYFVLASIIELFWLVYRQLLMKINKESFQFTYLDKSVNDLVVLFAVFFVCAVSLVLYVRSFVLEKDLKLEKTMGFVFGVCCLIFGAFVFLLWLKLMPFRPLACFLTCTVVFIIGIFFLLYLCTGDTFRKVFSIYKKELLTISLITVLWNFLYCSKVYESIYYSMKYTTPKYNIFTSDSSIFRLIIAVSIMYLVYKVKMNLMQVEEKNRDRRNDLVGMLSCYYAINILNFIIGINAFIQNVMYSLNMHLFNYTIINLTVTLLSIINITVFVFIFIFLNKWNLDNRMKIIKLLIIKVILESVNVIIIIFYSFANVSTNSNSLFYISFICSILATVVPSTFILIWFVKSKKIKEYYESDLVTEDLSVV